MPDEHRYERGDRPPDSPPAAARGRVVKVVCKGCGKRIGVRPDQAGRRLRCSGCGTAFQVEIPAGNARVLPPAPSAAPGGPVDESEEELGADEAGELILPGRATKPPPGAAAAVARFPESPEVVYDALVYAVRRSGSEVVQLDGVNRRVRFASPDGPTDHTACVFPDRDGGSELECRASVPNPLSDAGLYARLAAALTAYLAAHPSNKPPPAPAVLPAKRRRPRADDDRGFRCPYCRSPEFPVTRSKISTGGWVVFATMILFCFPLFWIGLLMTESYRECADCGMKVGG